MPTVGSEEKADSYERGTPVFRGGLVFKTHKLFSYWTLGLRVNKREITCPGDHPSRTKRTSETPSPQYSKNSYEEGMKSELFGNGVSYANPLTVLGISILSNRGKEFISGVVLEGAARTVLSRCLK